MDMSPARVARALAERAEAVCRHYLPAGRREGQYWLVGDVNGRKGRSLYVRLTDSERGRAGKWTDAASGEHGDLLDLIGLRCAHLTLRDTLAEAARLLGCAALDVPEPIPAHEVWGPRGSHEASVRLWRASAPLPASVAARYLARRGLTRAIGEPWLRSHQRCFYRPLSGEADRGRETWPALIAAVTDEADRVVGVHRTFLDPVSSDKAPVVTPRRAMGRLLGAGVRFGRAERVLAAGEGLETVLALRDIAPRLPSLAGLSAAHLAACPFPDELQLLYVIVDNDGAGSAAYAALATRAQQSGVDCVPLRSPVGSDLNDALLALGREPFARLLAAQMPESERARWLALA